MTQQIHFQNYNIFSGTLRIKKNLCCLLLLLNETDSPPVLAILYDRRDLSNGLASLYISYLPGLQLLYCNIDLLLIQWIPVNRDRFLQPKKSQLTENPLYLNPD